MSATTPSDACLTEFRNTLLRVTTNLFPEISDTNTLPIPVDELSPSPIETWATRVCAEFSAPVIHCAVGHATTAVPTHHWVFFNGRHYDPTCVEGVTNPNALPRFSTSDKHFHLPTGGETNTARTIHGTTYDPERPGPDAMPLATQVHQTIREVTSELVDCSEPYPDVRTPKEICGGYCREWVAHVTQRVAGACISCYHGFQTPERLAHAWVWFDGNHYDPMCREGVADPNDLPIFRRQSDAHTRIPIRTASARARPDIRSPAQHALTAFSHSQTN